MYLSQLLRYSDFLKMNSPTGIQCKKESIIGIPNVEVIAKAKFVSLISYQASMKHYP